MKKIVFLLTSIIFSFYVFAHPYISADAVCRESLSSGIYEGSDSTIIVEEGAVTSQNIVVTPKST